MSRKTSLVISILVGFPIFVDGAVQACNARKLRAIEVSSLEVIDVQSEEKHNFTEWEKPFDAAAVNLEDTTKAISFCSVTVTYTHPGQNDTINAYVWLPLDDTWNGNYLGMGGGAWAAGNYDSLPAGVALGYATANTDGGHSYFPDKDFSFVRDAESWGYLSTGNINWVNLQNFASRSLEDLPKIAKQVIKGFYDKAPEYSYWTGCSTGGRQGLMSAQRFPGDYDGILTAAPAINWATFVLLELWPHIVMRREKYWPEPAELAAIRLAAINACDALDGVEDGVISDPSACKFDAKSAVGQKYTSGEETRKISSKGAVIANAVWEGPVRGGKQEWFGNTHETNFGGIANTVCDENNKNCESLPFFMPENWNKLFLQKDKDFDYTKMTEDEFWRALDKSRREYISIIDTADADLSEFKATGGKIVNWHGLADEVIPSGGMAHYYERVLAVDPDASSFYRYFEAPGVGHCLGGPGAYPAKAFNSLVDWVENNIPPDVLEATTIPTDSSEEIRERILCPWPKVAAYRGGDPNKAESFECADAINQFSDNWPKSNSHEEL